MKRNFVVSCEPYRIWSPPPFSDLAAADCFVYTSRPVS